MIKAVIFDMDGVLINSEIEYIKLFQMFLAESGVFCKKEELYFLAGSSRQVEDRFMAKKLCMSIDEVNQKKCAFYDKHPINYRLIRKEYVIEILQYLKNKGVKIALASSSPIDNIEEVMRQCEIDSYFDFKVSGEMFVKTKPNPEIYEYTANRLGIAKDEILVVEDSSYGIEAAIKAGLKVIAVIDPIFNFDVSKATYHIHSLDEIKKWV